MLNPLKGLGDLNELRKQARQMQQMLAAEEVVVEGEGVRIVMTGDFKIKELVVDGEENWRLRNVLDEALKKVQEVAARKLAGMP